MRKEIYLNRLGTADVAQAFRQAVSELPAGSAVVFKLDPGVYPLVGKNCPKRFCAISNHDSGDRSIAFDFTSVSDIEFDGGGARFLCFGRVIPFFLSDCRDIVLRNFSIDWKRPFFTEGKILEVTESGVVRWSVDREKYPLQVIDGRLRFTGPDYESEDLDNAMEVDAARMEIAAHGRDSWGIRTEHSAMELPDGSVELTAPFGNRQQPGNILVIPHEHRTSPAIVLHRSAGIVIEDVSLHQAGGMGVIAQMCSHIAIRRLRACPSPERGSFTSLNADVTHFVECEGDILLQQCEFSGQMDDSTNVHGVYLPIKEVLGPNELIVEAAHAQQGSVDYYLPGETISIVDPATFAPSTPLLVESFQRLDHLRCLYRTREPLPADLAGKVITSGDRRVSFVAEDCHFHHYRTDGLLLSNPGKLRVRRNRFSLPGQGVLVTCDCGEWFESGRVDDLIIEDNDFEFCSFGQRPYPCAIRIAPNDTRGRDASSIVHRNIIVRKNRFRGRRPFITHYRAENLSIDDDNIYLDEAGQPVEKDVIVRTKGHSG